ncbi:Hypothetical_protein [Hexamita inflata]|uniref:Hypothetical_protein n=1 Tax=Hexamita inflata TaxID=28002 RepID=A0ABP1GIC8_9EUKA
MQSNCWFGHTTSSTPHLIPNCEVKSGQSSLKYRSRGDTRECRVYCRRFFFSRHLLFPSHEEFPECACSFRSGEPSAGFMSQNRKKSTMAVAGKRVRNELGLVH